MRDDHTAGLFYSLCNRIPVERKQAAQVDDLHANALLLHLLRCDQRALDQCAVSDDRQILTFTNLLCLPKRNHEVVSRILRLVIRLSIEMLVFEKQYRIVAANRGAKQSIGVERV